MKTITFIFALLAIFQLPAVPSIVEVFQDHDTLGQYEKFEVRLHLLADYENPFDPDQIDLNATFRSPGGEEWIIPGFYNYNNWRSLWMLRFSASEVGEWTYQISLTDQDSTVIDSVRSFTVVHSAYHGPIRISGNKRYLEYHDGTPYYGVGFWYNDGYESFNNGNIKPEVLDELKDLGLNFISTYITPLETMASGLGRYDQNICGRMDEVIEMCEEKDMMLSLNMWFHPFLSETIWPGGNRRWHTNPYQTICNVEDFYRNPLAWEYQKKLYRYFIARWSYSRALGIWFIIDEVNGTDGWQMGDSLQAAVWGEKVHNYLKENDPFQHLTTGTRSGGVREYWHEGYKIFDLPNREIYEAQGFPIIRQGNVDSSEVHPLTYSYLNYAGEVDKLWKNYDKPALIGETGWNHTFYEPGMPGFHAQFHNVLWVSLCRGTAMTPFWWAYSNFMNDVIVTNQMRNIARFTSLIPFNELSGLEQLDSITGGLHAFGMKSDQIIWGWLVDPVTDVTSEEVTIFPQRQTSWRGEYRLRLYHTWGGRWLEEQTITASDGKLHFEIPALKVEGGRAQYIGQDVAFILEEIR